MERIQRFLYLIIMKVEMRTEYMPSTTTLESNRQKLFLNNCTFKCVRHRDAAYKWRMRFEN